MAIYDLRGGGCGCGCGTVSFFYAWFIFYRKKPMTFWMTSTFQTSSRLLILTATSFMDPILLNVSFRSRNVPSSGLIPNGLLDKTTGILWLVYLSSISFIFRSNPLSKDCMMLDLSFQMVQLTS